MIIHKLVMNRISFVTKVIPKNLIVDKRFAITVFIERNIPSLKLFHFHRNCRIKITQNSLRSTHRHSPNSKKSQNMVNSHRIKILLQSFETVFPPTVTIFFHRFPIISWEFPVLSEICKLIRWCSGLEIHTKQFGFCPGFNRISINSDRQISFNRNS